MSDTAYRKLASSVLRSEGPSFEARALFLLLASFGNKDGSSCHPSMETLAVKSGHEIRWVKRHIRELRKFGWITSRTVAVPRGRVNLYSLHWNQIGPDRVGAKIVPMGRDQNGPKTLLHRPTYQQPFVNPRETSERSPFAVG